MEKFGIVETSEMITFIARMFSAADKALEDGDIDFMDSWFLLAPLKAAGEAVKGAKLIPSELTDLSSAEVDTIQAIVAEELTLRNEFAQELTGDLLEIAGKFALVIRKIKERKAMQGS